MAYTREQLGKIIDSGFTVIVCGKHYNNTTSLPSDEEIVNCSKNLPLNERDSFLGLPVEKIKVPQNKEIILWDAAQDAWKFTTLLEEIINMGCAELANEVRFKTDTNEQLINQACNLLDQQQQEITNLSNDATSYKTQITDLNTKILQLQVQLQDALNKSACDENTIALLENSIKRLGAANLKLENCLKLT